MPLVYQELRRLAKSYLRRERLNHQARDALRWLGDLGPDVEVAGRAWAVGDRVIARRNDRARDLDNLGSSDCEDQDEPPDAPAAGGLPVPSERAGAARTRHAQP